MAKNKEKAKELTEGQINELMKIYEETYDDEDAGEEAIINIYKMGKKAIREGVIKEIYQQQH